jgi:hypothetical protein
MLWFWNPSSPRSIPYRSSSAVWAGPTSAGSISPSTWTTLSPNVSSSTS